MKLKRFALATLALSLAPALMTAKAYSATPGPAAPAYAQDRDHDGGWDAPPSEFREIQREGFHDGIEGARKDFDNHRPPNVNNRDEYRHPHVKPSARDDYREGFRRGYDAATRHLTGGEQVR
jgi:hypothetical protein